MPLSSFTDPFSLPVRGRSFLAGLAGAALVLPVLAAPALAAAPPAPVAAPSEDVFVSELEWVSESNGLGPVERDRAVGGPDAGDGPVMSLGGTTYESGLGTHASSTVRVFLGARCRTFLADVGIDDSQGDLGSVTFAVSGDGEPLTVTPVLTGASAVETLEVDVRRVEYLDLEVDGGADLEGDHANWADARLVCNRLVGDIGQPVFVDLPGTASDTVTIPQAEGAVFVVNGTVLPPGTHPVLTDVVSVYVEALPGYQLDPYIDAPAWGFAFERGPDPTVPSETEQPTATGEPTERPAAAESDPEGAPTTVPTPTERATAGVGAGVAGGELARTGLDGPASGVALGLVLVGAVTAGLAAGWRRSATRR